MHWHNGMGKLDQALAHNCMGTKPPLQTRKAQSVTAPNQSTHLSRRWSLAENERIILLLEIGPKLAKLVWCKRVAQSRVVGSCSGVRWEM